MKLEFPLNQLTDPLRPTEEHSSSHWYILVVDDDHTVFDVTKIALSNYEFRGKGIKLLKATNESEAKSILGGDLPIAVVILDVVMENPDSGLRLVKYIRSDLGNNKTQIILRTAQPGDQPEELIVKHYSINDFKLKTELTREKLFTCITLAIRIYDQSRAVMDLANRLMVNNSKLTALNSNLEAQVQERTNQLHQKSNELSEAYMEICNLLRIMSHDQNNYLAIVLSNAEIIINSTADLKLKKRAESILWAVKTQRDLIQKILRFDALKTGKSSYEPHPVLLTEVLNQSHKTFEGQLHSKMISIEFNNRCHPDTKILVDPTIFVSSVLNNLISNAIKFSPEGSKIVIGCQLLASSLISITVQDEGVGIPPELLGSLFSFSVRTTRQGTLGEKGTGFGMPIVKSLVEKMNGSIAVHSSEKKTDSDKHGTTFILTVQQAA